MALNLIRLSFLLLLVACTKPVQKKKGIDFTDDYNRATAFLDSNPDSAFYLLNKIATGSQDNYMLGIVNTLMGRLQVKAGDDFGGQEQLLKGLSFFNPNDTNQFYALTMCYNELGNTSINIKNYDFAIDYYNKAIEKARDSFSRSIALNGKALAYQKKKDYAGAIVIFTSSLEKSAQDKKEYARVLSNLARTRWLQNPSYNALPELMEAKNIRESENDWAGMFTSYSHLSDYYSSTNKDSAIAYARKMYAIAPKLNNPNDELEALQKLLAQSPATEIKTYFTRFNTLNDSLQVARNAHKNQFALIKYEAEKIKSEKLELQKQNSEKEVQLIKQRIILYATLLLAALAFIFGTYSFRKRKRRMDREKQEALKAQQLQTSQKVHDVVANGLYRLMSDLEHEKNIDKEGLIGRVNELYEKSRDISYEDPIASTGPYENKIEALLTSFSSETTRVLLVGNSKEIWQNVSDHAKNELEHVLQELMVNMKKHSRAVNVVVKFMVNNTGLEVQYVDDGVGLPANFEFGNGLTSTENRIKKLGGDIIFDKAKARGTKINILFPIGSTK